MTPRTGNVRARRYATTAVVRKRGPRGGTQFHGPKGKLTKATARRLTRPTKKKLNQGVHETRGGSESAFSLGRRPKGRFMSSQSKICNNMYYTAQTDFVLTSTPGIQSSNDIYAFHGNVDIGLMYTQALNQQYGSATPLGYRTDKIVFEEVQAEVMYNNNSDDQVRLLLFDIVPKRDIYSTSGDAGTPNNAWFTGLSHELNGAPGTANQRVGILPFSSNLFTQFWTVKKITKLTLAPGQTHYHKIKHYPNKIVNGEIFAQPNLYSMKGLGLHHLSIQYGAPCLDNTGNGATVQSTKVLVITKTEYRFSYIANDMTTMTLGTTMATATAGTIMNMATAAASAYTQV